MSCSVVKAPASVETKPAPPVSLFVGGRMVIELHKDGRLFFGDPLTEAELTKVAESHEASVEGRLLAAVASELISLRLEVERLRARL